jgi:hypothetical protein
LDREVLAVTNRAPEAFRQLLSAFSGEPSPRLTLWGVTGPGQTSVAFLLHRCLAAGNRAGGLWADALGLTARPGARRGTGLPAALLLFLHELAARGGQAAVLSLYPGEPAGPGVPLDGLVILARRPPAWLDRPSDVPLLVVPAGWRTPPGTHPRCVSFGPGPTADLRYRRLSSTLRGQEVEFAAGARLLPGDSGASPVSSVWRARLTTPGPAARRAASAALAAALLAGLSPAAATSALAGFPGVYRRCQLIYDGPFAALDDLAQNPREVAATLAALAELDAGVSPESREGSSASSYRMLQPVCAVAGGRGTALNAALGWTLGRLLPRRRADRLLVTESLDRTPPDFRPSPDERVAFVAACRRAGLPVDYYPHLEDALSAALGRVRDGDLLLLLGGPGMNQGQAVLGDLLAARGLALDEPYDDWATGPLLRPLGLAELTRWENLPGSPRGGRDCSPLPLP